MVNILCRRVKIHILSQNNHMSLVLKVSIHPNPNEFPEILKSEGHCKFIHFLEM